GVHRAVRVGGRVRGGAGLRGQRRALGGLLRRRVGDRDGARVLIVRRRLADADDLLARLAATLLLHAAALSTRRSGGSRSWRRESSLGAPLPPSRKLHFVRFPLTGSKVSSGTTSPVARFVAARSSAGGGPSRISARSKTRTCPSPFPTSSRFPPGS